MLAEERDKVYKCTIVDFLLSHKFGPDSSPRMAFKPYPKSPSQSNPHFKVSSPIYSIGSTTPIHRVELPLAFLADSPHRPSSITHPEASPATVTCSYIGWHRWILGWGNLARHDDEAFRCGKCMARMGFDSRIFFTGWQVTRVSPYV
jgi:hypothetical protein